MSQTRSRSGVLGPLLLIGLGIYFLLHNMGWVHISLWQLAARLWPVLLIAAGLDLALGRRSAWGALLTVVLVAALVAGSLMLIGSPPSSPIAGQEVEVPLEGAEEATVYLRPELGWVRLGGLAEGNRDLIEGRCHPPCAIEAERSVQGVRRLEVRLDGRGWESLSILGSGLGPSWDLGLSGAIPVELSLELGTGRLEVDLRQLNIHQAEVHNGLGETTIWLPSVDGARLQVDGGIGDIRLRIPEGVGVRLRADTGIGPVDLPADFEARDEVFVSPGYDAAPSHIEVSVDLGIGAVRVR